MTTVDDETVLVPTSYRVIKDNGKTATVTSPPFIYGENYGIITSVTITNVYPREIVTVQFCGRRVKRGLSS